MGTFATEVAQQIRSRPEFQEDLALLRAHGIMATLPGEANVAQDVTDDEHGVPLETHARLVSSANVFAQAVDEQSKDLAQQIAIFSALTSKNGAIVDGAVTILAQLGNFPGLEQLDTLRTKEVSLQTFIRRGLLAEINTVLVGGVRRALTEFQLDVWNELQNAKAIAISAPTSAGKSFVVLEHLRSAALEAERFLAIYIAPTRALLAEVQANLELQLRDLGDDVRVTTIPVGDPLDRPKQIYVLTQERLQLLLSVANLQDQVNLIIVDEAQAIGDDARGMILQDTLEKVRHANPQARILFLAPGADGFKEMGSSVGLGDLCVHDTMLSPVVQNRIVVSFSEGDETKLDLSLLTVNGNEEPIGTFQTSRGLGLAREKRLAAVALELGAMGRSLVYATGAARAEDLARQLWGNRSDYSVDDSGQKAREKLAKFIEKDVHKAYSLSKFVRRGVAFHYGNMPSLLREGIEGAFRNGYLDYLCCTTTLFQGVNLPARNVFIDTPDRGNQGEKLDEASLWNFAGRAGRLGRDVVGNVFLVGYKDWETQPLTHRKRFVLRVAFQQAMTEEFEQVVDILNNIAQLRTSEIKPSARASSAAGLALYRAAQNDLEQLINRPGMGLSDEQKARLIGGAGKALEELKLPATVLAANWMIDPLALASLLGRLREKVKKSDFKGLIPINPTLDGYEVYNSIIRRMYKHLGGVQLSGTESKKMRGYLNHVTVTALKWMRGEPLSQLVSEAVSWKQRNVAKTGRNEEQLVDAAIRDMFVLLEQTIRFQLVQWAKAYVDLVRLALIEANHHERAIQVYDFSLALELGVATETGRSLVELGLSRISAASIAGLILDSKMTPEAVKSWIHEQGFEVLKQLSELVLDELKAKGLLPDTAEDVTV